MNNRANPPKRILHQLLLPLALGRAVRAALVLLGLSLAGCSSAGTHRTTLPTPDKVDLSRYVGRWFEIARLPTPFQKANEAAVAKYGSNPDGTISVQNIAIRPDGSQHEIRGTAQVLNPPANTKLAVRFNTWFGPLIPVSREGNYWILHLDARYQEALVGTPDRKYLWLLARTARIPESRYTALVSRAERLGFDVSRLRKDPAQSADKPPKAHAPARKAHLSGTNQHNLVHAPLLAKGRDSQRQVDAAQAPESAAANSPLPQQWISSGDQ